jgi:hypothetical protein
VAAKQAGENVVRPFEKASDRCSVTLGSMPGSDDRCSTFWADGLS